MAFSSARPSSGDDRDDSDEMGSIVAEINITPLVDVFLVLLIIFMVTSSVMSQLGVSVSLPKASAETSQTQADGVIVTLLAGGKVRIAERELSLSNESGAAGDGDSEQNLKELLKLAFGKTKEKLVILETLICNFLRVTETKL